MAQCSHQSRSCDGRPTSFSTSSTKDAKGEGSESRNGQSPDRAEPCLAVRGSYTRAEGSVIMASYGSVITEAPAAARRPGRALALAAATMALSAAAVLTAMTVKVCLEELWTPSPRACVGGRIGEQGDCCWWWWWWWWCLIACFLYLSRSVSSISWVVRECEDDESPSPPPCPCPSPPPRPPSHTKGRVIRARTIKCSLTEPSSSSSAGCNGCDRPRADLHCARPAAPPG